MRDHARLCEGREYTCTCGYDEQREHAFKDMLGVLKVSVDHIALMYSAIAGGNADAGQNFADKDPVVKAMRDAIDKAEASA
jgi:hypothetical protein